MKLLQNIHNLLTSDTVRNPLRLPRRATSQLARVLQTCRCLTHLTWKYASRQNRVNFFNFHISTLKSAPRQSVFTTLTWKCASRQSSMHFFDMPAFKSATNPSVVHTFDFEIALRHKGLHFFNISMSKWSQHGVFCTS